MPKNPEGKHFSSKFRMSRHAAAHTEEHEAKETPSFEAGEQEGMKEGPEDVHEVVAQHGPAHEINIKHDHKANKHTVVSHHGSFVHTTEQPSAEEAHAHAQAAAGMENSAGY